MYEIDEMKREVARKQPARSAPVARPTNAHPEQYGLHAERVTVVSRPPTKTLSLRQRFAAYEKTNYVGGQLVRVGVVLAILAVALLVVGALLAGAVAAVLAHKQELAAFAVGVLIVVLAYAGLRARSAGCSGLHCTGCGKH